MRRRHCRLDRQTPDILPPFLKQTDQIIDCQHDVSNQLILRHPYVANRHTETQHLLELEFYSRFDFCEFVVEVFGVRNWGGEFAGCRA